MSWAARYIEKLQKGETVQFRPRGSSMTGKIESGQLVTVVPTSAASAQPGQIVLCRVHGSEYLHLVKAVQSGRCLIGNNHGKINGWTRSVYGLCTQITD